MTATTVTEIIPPEAGRYQYRYCAHPGCNNVFLANLCGKENDLCPEHRREENHEREERRERKAYWIPDYSRRIVIVHDPLPMEEGGFEPGAILDPLDWFITLLNGSLTPGLVFRYQRTVWTVTGVGGVSDETGAKWYVDYKGRLRKVNALGLELTVQEARE